MLKLVSAIFYQSVIFSQNDSPLKTMKNVFLSHRKSSFCSQEIHFLYFFPLHTFWIQKDKWKSNSL